MHRTDTNRPEPTPAMPERRRVLAASLATVAAASALPRAWADPPVSKIGVILPLTGPNATIGKQVEQGVRLWLHENGNRIAGRPVEVLIKDDGGVADATRRLAQEFVVQDKVTALAGFGLTPLALAAAPVATQGRTPMVVMAAATSAITEASPFIVRTSFTLPQAAVAMSEWAAKKGLKNVVTLVADYGPGNDAEKFFADRMLLNGGQIAARLRTPLRAPDFAPVLQKARDAKPQALFVFLPSGQGAAFMKQFGERGLAAAGIQLIATGDVLDDDQLDEMGDVAVGVVNAHHYSADHPSAANRRFVAAFQALHQRRPNFMAVGGYDGMRLLAKGLERTRGAGGAPLLEAMKGQMFESPRGPVLIDAQTRDVVQDIYIRKVERRDGHLWNVEFDTLKAVKDPGKAK